MTGFARPGRRGLTYVEMLLVVAVMSILTALVLPTARTVHRRAQEKELLRALQVIRQAIDEYHDDWVKGCIESDDEYGWPSSLAELTEGVEFGKDPACVEARKPPPPPPPSKPGERPMFRPKPPAEEEEPEPKVYLERLPRDPFNVAGDTRDTDGWNARSYRDEPDETSWKGDAVYDVRSSSEWTALDGSLYSEW